VLVDSTGPPLDLAVSGTNRHDSMLIEPNSDSMSAIERGGHPRRRLLSYMRLALRYDRTAQTTAALPRLAVTLTCARRIPTN
jgi:hypothetical protein